MAWDPIERHAMVSRYLAFIRNHATHGNRPRPCLIGSDSMINPDAFTLLISSIFARVSGRAGEDVTPETVMLDLGLDSLGFVTAVAHVEVACHLRVTPHDMLRLVDATTLAEIVALFRRIAATREGEAVSPTDSMLSMERNQADW